MWFKNSFKFLIRSRCSSQPEWILCKSEESRPPKKWKIIVIFSKNACKRQILKIFDIQYTLMSKCCRWLILVPDLVKWFSNCCNFYETFCIFSSNQLLSTNLHFTWNPTLKYHCKGKMDITPMGSDIHFASEKGR